MVITKKNLPRRTFLRGTGMVLALPLLDAMVPALSAAPKAIPRVGFFYVPNGMHMGSFVPKTAGAHFELSPILQPLAAFKDQMTVVSGTANKGVYGDDAGAPHTRCAGAWLSGVRPKRTEGSDIQAGVTIDQIVARHLGQDTQLPSLELALDPSFTVGACPGGYSCTYVNTTSWRTPTSPLPMENNPRAVFERLFGDGATGPARQALLRRNRSILDAVMSEVAGLQRVLGAGDRLLVSEYLDAVREVETRIQKAEQRPDELPVAIDPPAGIPVTFQEHIQLMFDLQYLAYRADITRVSSLQIGREQSARSYPETGVDASHHDVSHMGSAARVAMNVTINTYHTSQFAYLLKKLRETPDGDGTLLDHTMLWYGGGMGDGGLHSPHNLPMLLMGGGCGTLKGDQHITAVDTPLMNVGVSLFQKLGVPQDSIGDSTGAVVGL